MNWSLSQWEHRVFGRERSSRRPFAATGGLAPEGRFVTICVCFNVFEAISNNDVSPMHIHSYIFYFFNFILFFFFFLRDQRSKCF